MSPTAPPDRDLRTWDGLARRYDAVVRRLGGRYRDAARLMREDLAGRRRVLEVAAGTGLFTLEIARVAPEVVATDFSPGMLVELRAKLVSQHVANVEALERDARALGFDDASFDAVVCANALHVMPAPDEVAGEIRRVLRPGGLLVAPTFCHGQSPLARLVSVAMSAVSSFRAYTRFSDRSLRAFAEAHGFEVRRCHPLGSVLPLVYLSALRRA